MEKIPNNPFPGPVLVEEDSQRPFLEHLEELRRRLLRCFLWIGLGVIFCWGQAERVLSFLLKPVGPVVYLSPVEPFVVRMKTAFLGGLLVVFPLIAWEVWSFLRPAVRPGVRWTLVPLIAASAGLFFAGNWFGWAVLLPTALFFLRGFANDLLVPMITVGHYVSFATWTVIGCGLIFQLPLGVLAATRAGWIRPAVLARQWRVATVAILIAAAVLTPTPDIFTQLLLAAPLAVLYVASVGLSGLVAR